MVSSDLEMSTHQVLFEVFQRVDDCQQLFPGDAIVHFSFIEYSTGICNDSFNAVLDLGQNCSDRLIASVCI